MKHSEAKIGYAILWKDYYNDTYPGIILKVNFNRVKIKVNHLKGDKVFWTYAHKIELQ